MTTRTPAPTADDVSGRATALPEQGSGVPLVHKVEAPLARRFHQICLGALAEVTGPENLSPLDYGVLASLDDAPGIDQRRLAERIGIDPVSAHKVLGRLEALGLVDRRVGPVDRRSRALYLTPDGVALRRRLRPRVLAAQDRMTACLSDAERRTLRELLSRVIEANEAYARPGNGRRAPRRTKAVPGDPDAGAEGRIGPRHPAQP